MKMPNSSQEPQVSSNSLNQDYKDMVDLCTFKKMEKAKIQNMGLSCIIDNIQIIFNIPNPSQEYPAASKAPIQYWKDMDVLCTLKINIESHSSGYVFIKNHWP